LLIGCFLCELVTCDRHRLDQKCLKVWLSVASLAPGLDAFELAGAEPFKDDSGRDAQLFSGLFW
jgi:hypothetical protein